MTRRYRWLPVAAGTLIVTALAVEVRATSGTPLAVVEVGATSGTPSPMVEVRSPASLETTAKATTTRDPDPTWVARTATAAGIPVPAMRAYARAQLARPAGCAIGWTTLAGIGWVESQHGTLGGRTLADDGRPSAPIVGPALGALDHAYGPMQFIPSTWERWAADGDGDGVADVDDLDDAAMTAMRYLCGTGDDLATGEGWAQAVFAYNHAQTYVDSVYSAAETYAHRTAE